MEKIIFSCTVTNNSESPDLGLEFWLDDNKFFDSKIKKGSTLVTYNFDEDEANHCLKIVMKNKTIDHTTVDNTGKIISDCMLEIHDIMFDGINIDQIFIENSIYSHDFNGSGAEIKDKFYGNIGCNGTIELNFSTPFYVWLLEHM